MAASPLLTPTQPAQTEHSITSCTEARCFAVPACAVDAWWPQVEPLVNRWVDFDELWSADGVREDLVAGKATLWCMHDSSVVGIWITRIENSDVTPWGLVWVCAGDFSSRKAEAITFYNDVIERWFREHGCKFVDWAGRDGWTRLFPEYKRHAVIMRKRL